MVSGDVAGIQGDRSFELTFGRRRIPGPIKGGEGKRIVRLGGIVVQLHGFLCRRQRPRISLIRWHHGILAHQVIAVGKAHIGLSITGVTNDRLGEEVQSLVQIFGRPFVPEIATL